MLDYLHYILIAVAGVAFVVICCMAEAVTQLEDDKKTSDRWLEYWQQKYLEADSELYTTNYKLDAIADIVNGNDETEEDSTDEEAESEEE